MVVVLPSLARAGSLGDAASCGEMAQDDELIPVVLENDRLVGVGWSYIRRMTDRYGIPAPLEQR